MTVGEVKWFDEEKGYGFIESDEHDEDVFVHYSDIEQSGFKSLSEGDDVQFEVERSDEGLSAQDVQRQ